MPNSNTDTINSLFTKLSTSLETNDAALKLKLAEPQLPNSEKFAAIHNHFIISSSLISDFSTTMDIYTRMDNVNIPQETLERLQTQVANSDEVNKQARQTFIKNVFLEYNDKKKPSSNPRTSAISKITAYYYAENAMHELCQQPKVNAAFKKTCLDFTNEVIKLHIPGLFTQDPELHQKLANFDKFLNTFSDPARHAAPEKKLFPWQRQPYAAESQIIELNNSYTVTVLTEELNKYRAVKAQEQQLFKDNAAEKNLDASTDKKDLPHKKRHKHKHGNAKEDKQPSTSTHHHHRAHRTPTDDNKSSTNTHHHRHRTHKKSSASTPHSHQESRSITSRRKPK